MFISVLLTADDEGNFSFHSVSNDSIVPSAPDIVSGIASSHVPDIS